MIREVVVTSVDAAGEPHVAPMGVRDGDGRVVLAPFRPSRTLDNVVARERAVVNATDDVRVFAGCVTGRRGFALVATDCGVPRLSSALAHEELVLEAIEEDPERPRLVCRVIATHAHAPFRGLNRAQGAVVEAAVLVSRLHLLPREKVERELRYLAIAIERTAGEREREAWAWIVDAVKAHHAAAAQQA
jgi:hypothetical protein